MSKTAEELKDTLNDIERDVYDGLNLGGMFTKAYVLADELGESIDKLREQNAKLRELTQQMFALIENHEETKYMDGELGRQIVNAVYERMKELGIEVDG